MVVVCGRGRVLVPVVEELIAKRTRSPPPVTSRGIPRNSRLDEGGRSGKGVEEEARQGRERTGVYIVVWQSQVF